MNEPVNVNVANVKHNVWSPMPLGELITQQKIRLEYPRSTRTIML